MDFIKKTELQLINGGYLANKAGDPVNHESFVAQQNTAHYLVSLVDFLLDFLLDFLVFASATEICKSALAISCLHIFE